MASSVVAILSSVLLVHFLAIINVDLGDCRYSRRYVAKSIETEYGDVYDCVDFYRQPALNHPSMKNHTFHPGMKPSSTPKWPKHDDTTYSSSGTNDIEVDSLDVTGEEGGCPFGTVPIARMMKVDEVGRAKGLSPESELNVIKKRPGTHFALVQTESNPGTKWYNGAGATITVYNPRTVAPYYSSGEVIIQGGSDSIVVGWTVNPSVYKDSKTRIFVYAVSGGTQCFNSRCGFVTVSRAYRIGSYIKSTSERGGPIYTFTFGVAQDAESKLWWLYLGKNHTAVGFWPGNFFRDLANSASYVAFGGEVYGDRQWMGNGWKPYEEDPQLDAYVTNMLIINEAHEAVPAKDDVIAFTDVDSYFVSYKKDFLAHHSPAFFGGPLA